MKSICRHDLFYFFFFFRYSVSRYFVTRYFVTLLRNTRLCVNMNNMNKSSGWCKLRQGICLICIVHLCTNYFACLCSAFRLFFYFFSLRTLKISKLEYKFEVAICFTKYTQMRVCITKTIAPTSNLKTHTVLPWFFNIYKGRQ